MEIYAGGLVGVLLAAAYLIGRHQAIQEERAAEELFRWTRTAKRLESHADENGMIGGVTVETLATLASTPALDGEPSDG